MTLLILEIQVKLRIHSCPSKWPNITVQLYIWGDSAKHSSPEMVFTIYTPKDFFTKFGLHLVIVTVRSNYKHQNTCGNFKFDKYSNNILEKENLNQNKRQPPPQKKNKKILHYLC